MMACSLLEKIGQTPRRTIMKKISVLTATFFITCLFAAGPSLARDVEHPMGGGWEAQFGSQQVKAANEISNFTLRDQQGQDLGQINQVLLDTVRGQIGYVVVQSPTGQSHVIPWNALLVDPEHETLTLTMDADRFRNAPTGDAQMVQDLNQAQQLHQFYGVSPYWESDMIQQFRTPTRQSPERQTPGMQEYPPAGPKPPGTGIR
jgi:hypothetical protein